MTIRLSPLLPLLLLTTLSGCGILGRFAYAEDCEAGDYFISTTVSQCFIAEHDPFLGDTSPLWDVDETVAFGSRFIRVLTLGGFSIADFFASVGFDVAMLPLDFLWQLGTGEAEENDDYSDEIRY